MKRAGRVSALLSGSLACLLPITNAAIAHSPSGPTLPIQHAALVIAKPFFKPVIPHHAGANVALAAFLSKGSGELLLSRLNHQLVIANLNASFPGPGSIATRHVAALLRSVVENGVKTGEASVPPFGGNIVNGQIQGDLYVVSPDDPIPFYQNAGEFTGTVGTNLTANVPTAGLTFFGEDTLTPGFQNTLTFAPPQLSGSPIGGVSSSILLSKVSGSARLFLSQLFGLSQRSAALGQQIGRAGNTITGGIFYGTAYRNSAGDPTYIASSFGVQNPLFNPSPLYIFAFGNNPLNNPAGFRQVLEIPTANSTISFANGVTKTISNGQILYPMVGLGGSENGSVLTFGANPANNNELDSIITNLNSFLFF